jgi:hypothetical protein
MFLNSKGAYGARIPADAQPASLQRYVYQFRIGPTEDWMNAVIGSLPPDLKTSWTGKFGDLPPGRRAAKSASIAADTAH